jgi:hypothetical protein
MLSALSIVLACSVAGNVFLILFLNRKPEKPTAKDAKEILHDLTANGVALVKIERIAPADVFLRSPRG